MGYQIKDDQMVCPWNGHFEIHLLGEFGPLKLHRMRFSTIIIGVPLSTAFAFFGRWIQLHPEKVVMKGIFMSPHTFGARLFRAQVAIVGTLAVFGGTWCVVFALLSRLALVSLALGWVAQLFGLCAGVYAAVYVRKEVRARPEYVSNNPHGWWP